MCFVGATEEARVPGGVLSAGESPRERLAEIAGFVFDFEGILIVVATAAAGLVFTRKCDIRKPRR